MNRNATTNLIVAIAAALLAVGCASVRTNGNIVSITSTVFGLDVAPDPAGGTIPHVRLGLVRSEVLLAPTNAQFTAQTDAKNIGLSAEVHRRVQAGR